MERIVNPASGRKIVYRGRRFRELVREGYVYDRLLKELRMEPLVCNRFASDAKTNPLTERSILRNGSVARSLRHKCAKDGYVCEMWQQSKFMVNPLTNRPIVKEKPTWKRLFKRCAPEQPYHCVHPNLVATQTVVGKYPN
jgi:hypothetical protein